MPKKISLETQGIIWSIITCLLVSIMIAIVRYLSDYFHVLQIVMMRNFFTLLFLFPFIFKNITKSVKTKCIKLHFLRGFSGFISMSLWFYVVTIIPLSESVAITFTVPIITTIAAIFILKEKVHNKIWTSLIIGFIGVLIVIRPGFREINFAYLLAIITPFMWANSNILTKKLVATERPETITFYVSLTMLILSIPISAPYLQSVSIKYLFWFLFLGLISNLSYLSSAICYTKTDVSVVQPFDFTRLIFTAIIAYFAFNEKLDLIMFTGAAVILFGSLLAIPKRSVFLRYKSKILKKKEDIASIN